MADDTGPVVVGTFTTPIEAEIARGALEAAKIDAFLLDDKLIAINALLSSVVGGVKVAVPAEQASARGKSSRSWSSPRLLSRSLLRPSDDRIARGSSFSSASEERSSR